MICCKACHGHIVWAGPSRAETFEDLMGRPGPGREKLKMGWDGPGRGPWDVVSIWAAPPGPWGGPCVLTGRPGSLPMRSGVLYCYYSDVHRAHEAAHVFRRAGPGRGPWDVVYCCYSYDLFGCAWVVIRQKQQRSYDAFLANPHRRKI